MANNNALYNAIVAGITAGNQKRWELTYGGDFTIYRNLVLVIATEIDGLIDPLSPPPNAGQIALMHSICEGYIQDQAIETIRHTLPNVASTIVTVYNQLDTLLVEPGPAAVGETIPNGTYVGQPISWDGDNWTPLPEDEGLKIGQVSAIPGPSGESNTFVTIDGSNNFIGLTLNSVQPTSNQIAIMNYDENDDSYGSGILVNQNEVVIKSTTSFGNAQYIINGSTHEFSGNGQSILKMTHDGTEGKIGFFGAIPVPAQAITGGTDSEVLESMIDALVLYGLIVDDR